VGYGGVLQVGVDLFDDGVTAVGLSAATVSRSLRSVVVKNAWKRQVSNKAACPAPAWALRSRMRQTTSRPGTCSATFLEANAVNGISATCARETNVPVASSKTASVYSIVVHASASMLAIAALTFVVSRTVTDTSAPARSAAAMVGRP